MSRTKNAVRNAFYGILLKMYQTVMPFVIRTVMLYCLGDEYLGLNGLFTSVLQILNIAELGISSAMTFSMYEPIAMKNDKRICELLRLYRVYYFYIGLFIFAVGVILLPFIPNLISGKVPADINVHYLFVMYLASTVLSYWLFSYRGSVLDAHQRNDIISKIQIISSTVQFTLQIILLLVFKNYYLYIIIQLLVQLFQQFAIYIYAKKLYPTQYPTGEIDSELKRRISQKVKDLATAKFGAVILNSSDTVVISMFLGLTVLAVYQNYFYLITAVIGFIGMIIYGSMAGIGNSLVMETVEKNYNDFKRFTFIISWIVCICTCCFLCLFQPFMKIWVGETRMLPFSMVILFCIYFFLYEYNQLFNLYKDAAGLWHEDRFRPLITSLVNLGMNLWLVQHIGIYGIILSTILSMLFVGMPWLLTNLFGFLFERNIFEYMKSIAKYVVVTFISAGLSYLCTYILNVHGIIGLIVNGVVAVGVSCGMYVLVFRKSEYYAYTINTVKRIVFRT